MTTKTTNLISVIIPVYNSEKYLKECLNSIFNQTLKEIEVICVNDGSTDGSGKILTEYAQKYQNLKVITQKNKGVIEARITGFKNATGKYIGWVDNDDFIEKDMYEKLYTKALEDDYDIVICNYNFYPHIPKLKSKWFNEYKGIKDWKFIHHNTLQWNKIVKKELLEKIDLINLYRQAGEGSYRSALLEAKKIATINECLYNYRVGHTSLSTNYQNINWFKINLDREIKERKLLKKYELDNQWSNYFDYLVLHNYLSLFIVAAYNQDKKEFNLAKKEITTRKLFSDNNYKEFIINDIGSIKYYAFKYFLSKSYYLTLAATKIILK